MTWLRRVDKPASLAETRHKGEDKTVQGHTGTGHKVAGPEVETGRVEILRAAGQAG